MKMDFENLFSDVPVDLHHLIPGFLDRRQREVGDLMDLCDKGDLVAIRGVAHKMKGTGAGYGFQSITDLGRELEVAAVNGDLKRVEALIANLKELVKALVEAFEHRGDRV